MGEVKAKDRLSTTTYFPTVSLVIAPHTHTHAHTHLAS